MNGDVTIHIVSTPYFPDSPAPTIALDPAVTKTKLCLRLFEDSSSEWTADSSSNDWTTDSEADEPEIPFGWCATP